MKKPNTIQLVNISLGISIVIFTIFYNVGAGVAILFNRQPATINFIIKAAGSVINIFLIMLFAFNKRIYIQKLAIPLLLFWLIYTFRLLIDTQYRNLSSNYSTVLVLSYALAGSLSSVIAIVVFRKYLQPKKIISIFYVTLLLANIIIVLLLILKPNSSLLLNFRLSFGLNDSANQDIINSVTISVNGALLLLMGMIFIFLKKTFPEFEKYKLYIYLALPLGFINLVLGGSRGPFVSMTVLLIIIYLQKEVIYNPDKIVKILMLPFKALFFMILIAVLLVSSNSASFIINRIYSDGSLILFNDQNRDLLYNSAWKQFLEHPLFGDRYFEVVTKSYPHNIVLESLMSTGILGTTFLILHFLILFYVFISTRRQFTYSTIIMYICFFFFLCSLFSGSIWGNIECWVFSALTISAATIGSRKTTETKQF